MKNSVDHQQEKKYRLEYLGNEKQQQKKYNNAVKKNKTKKQLATQCTKCSFVFGDGQCSKHENWCYKVNKKCRDFKEKE